jgi:hypothetical protein
MDSTEWSDYLKQFDLPYQYFQNITSNTNKFCVIVEPRKHKFLIPVIKNVMYLLQKKNWGLIIVHGSDNEQFLNSELSKWPNVQYIKMPFDNLNINAYNYIMCSPTIWKAIHNIGCRHALMFQCDVVLLKDNVDDFLQYDYIGAPWQKHICGLKKGFNGGFSLRNVEKMLIITLNYKPYVFNNAITLDDGSLYIVLNEDVYFSLYLTTNEHLFNLPDKNSAKLFSVESIAYHDPLGMHQPHLSCFDNKDDFFKILAKRHHIDKISTF